MYYYTTVVLLKSDMQDKSVNNNIDTIEKIDTINIIQKKMNIIPNNKYRNHVKQETKRYNIGPQVKF